MGGGIFKSASSILQINVRSQNSKEVKLFQGGAGVTVLSILKSPLLKRTSVIFFFRPFSGLITVTF
jgi:hypothetical protein